MPAGLSFVFNGAQASKQAVLNAWRRVRERTYEGRVSAMESAPRPPAFTLLMPLSFCLLHMLVHAQVPGHVHEQAFALTRYPRVVHRGDLLALIVQRQNICMSIVVIVRAKE